MKSKGRKRVMSGGNAGIAIGIVVLLGLIGIAIYFVFSDDDDKSPSSSPSPSPSPSPGPSSGSSPSPSPSPGSSPGPAASASQKPGPEQSPPPPPCEDSNAKYAQLLNRPETARANLSRDKYCVYAEPGHCLNGENTARGNYSAIELQAACCKRCAPFLPKEN